MYKQPNVAMLEGSAKRRRGTVVYCILGKEGVRSQSVRCFSSPAAQVLQALLVAPRERGGGWRVAADDVV